MNFKISRKAKSKGKTINKLCQKLSNMSINTGLNLKTKFVWAREKEAYNNKSVA